MVLGLGRWCGTILLENPKVSRVHSAPGIVLTNASGEREIVVTFCSPPYLPPAWPSVPPSTLPVWLFRFVMRWHWFYVHTTYLPCSMRKTSFQHIWCLGPCLRTWKINCAFFRTFFTVCMAATCGPCAETCGLYFAKIKVRYQRLPDSDGGDHKDIMIVWYHIWPMTADQPPFLWWTSSY